MNNLKYLVIFSNRDSVVVKTFSYESARILAQAQQIRDGKEYKVDYVVDEALRVFQPYGETISIDSNPAMEVGTSNSTLSETKDA